MTMLSLPHICRCFSFFFLLLLLLTPGCAFLHGADRREPLFEFCEQEVRFLLTFDDGPAPGATAFVLDQLRSNPVQPGIKAVFFVQTRSPCRGGSEAGRLLMKRQHEEMHLLALHSGSSRGHLNHTTMQPSELQQSLLEGMNDIAAITGSAPLLVRPPYWRHNGATLAMYENSRLHMLLSDVKAYDGGSGSFPLNSLFKSQRRGTMLSELQRVKGRIARRELPEVNGIVPVVVTFHDTNSHTVRHLIEYLELLLSQAAEAGLRLSSRPFYDNRDELQAAALERAQHKVIPETRLPARLSRFFRGSWE